MQYLLQHSAACTLMNKLRLNSRRQVFLRFGKTLRINTETPMNQEGQKKKKETYVEFKIQPTLTRTEKFNTNPIVPFESFYYSLRTKTKLYEECSICGSIDRVEMHHLKPIKQGKTNNTFTSIISNQQRKQIPLCHCCHTKVHKGQYDGLKLNKIKYS